MATLQMQRPKTKNWSSIFPEEQLSETHSMLFVKKLLAVAVSSVTYLRAIFPENAFGERSLEDLKLKILREDNACPGACHVIQWMKGCFDALDKKYLRMILIGIYENPEDPDTIIEQYTFKFNYNDKNGVDIYRNKKKIIGASTEEQTKKATIRLLRTLILLSQTLSPLPDDVMMTMKLFYYDEVTPSEYQPPGFKDCAADPFAFKEESMTIRVGEVSTPFHQMTLKVGTIHHQLKYKDGDEIEELACDEQQTGEETPTAKKITAKKPSMLQAISKDQFEDVPDTFDPDSRIGQDSDGVPDDEMPCATDRIPETYEPSSGKKGLATRAEVSSQIEDDAEPAVCCHCGVNQDDGLMILCGVCETWQHAVCFAILESADAPVTHTCATCAEKFDDHRCTDPRLERLNRNELQATCLWRRAMIATSEMTRITVNLLTRRLGTTSTIASHILKRLEKEGYVKTTSKNKRIGKFVNKEKILQDGVCTYFRTSQDVCQSDTNSQESNDAPTAECVNAIVMRASKMELEEKKPQQSSQDKEMSDIQDICREKTRKRVISTVNEGDEFEISDSQDVMDVPSELRPAKRSKASAAVHSLLV